MKKLIIAALATSICLGGCAVAKTSGAVIAAPVKVTAKTAELAGKGVYGTGKFAGNTVIGTGKLAGKAVIGTGKGLYYVGSTPVHIANGALDTSNKFLTVTTQMVDLSGKVVTVSRDIQAVQLETELMKYRGAQNVLQIAVDVLR